MKACSSAFPPGRYLGAARTGQAPGKCRQADRRHHPVLGERSCRRRSTSTSTCEPFDTPIDRRGSDSFKWGKYAGRDILPLWVADMDFRGAPAVLDALHRRIEHGVFGYGGPWPSLDGVGARSPGRRSTDGIEPEWLVWLPGLVTGLNVAAAVDGEVLTATPIYPPFRRPRSFRTPAQARRPGARPTAGTGTWPPWSRRRAPRPGCSCSAIRITRSAAAGRARRTAGPGRYAERHDLIVCSDEIHCGLILDAATPLPFASLSPAPPGAASRLLAPSKTFNIPGLGCALAVIPDASAAPPLEQAMDGIVPHVRCARLVGEAAVPPRRRLAPELIAHLRGNRDRVAEVVGQACPAPK